MNEQILLKLTSTLILDFMKFHTENGTDFDEMTVSEIIDYCRLWIKENIKD